MPHDLTSLESDRERTLLVGISIKGSRPLLSAEDSLEELGLLADTAGMEVIGAVSQSLARVDPSTFVGSGKADEIKERLIAENAHVVIFDDELSPRHQRELEERFGEDIKVLDRSALILDIFAQHARTHEGALQVELAQYEYRLPRLTRQWTHLARQAGGGSGRGGNAGVGLRGPGETQLEVDRREVRRRISTLKAQLEQVRLHRSRHRAQRSRTGVPLIALVGYTNAGKSTLLNALSGADVYIANQLFATLDPTTRRIELPSGRAALLTDTVGFIQKLPTTLIAAFRATLEEIAEADVLLVVTDVSQPNVLSHIETVEETLAEIDVPPIPRILVWNQIDRLSEAQPLPRLARSAEYVAEVAVSALTGEGLPSLRDALEKTLGESLYRMRLRVPYERGDLVAELHNMAAVQTQTHEEDGVHLTVHVRPDMYERFKPYRIPG